MLHYCFSFKCLLYGRSSCLALLLFSPPFCFIDSMFSSTLLIDETAVCFKTSINNFERRSIWTFMVLFYLLAFLKHTYAPKPAFTLWRLDNLQVGVGGGILLSTGNSPECSPLPLLPFLKHSLRSRPGSFILIRRQI